MKGLSRVRQEREYLAIQMLHHDKEYPVAELCRILKLNRSSYYKWLHRDVSKQEQSDKILINCLRTLYQESSGIFGYRRMQLNLKRRFGLYCNLKRVRRVMRAIGMCAVIRRKRPDYIRTTPEVTAENVLNREFKASAVNEKWVTDVTELKYGKDGRMYLSAILDLKDKSIVSYNMGAKNDFELVFRTFDTAVEKYPEAKPMLHSDRGSQYTSKQYRSKLDQHGMKQSMSRVGRCIDNGPMEAFWGTLKAEMYYLNTFSDYDSLKASIDRYIHFYNYQRYQIGLGGLAPLEYRSLLAENG